jgi:beta-fructofuranosidase
MYTGVSKETIEDGSVREVQTQCLAVGDGLEYEKYEKNPVITDVQIPEGSSKYDFRDPKIWKDEDGTYYAVVANRPADGSGQILLYESENAFDWKFKSVLLENKYRFGNMWECPDMFELDGKWVLLVNPVEMLAEGLEYHNGHMSVGLVGDFDKKKGTFKVENHQSIDQGIDFYATQTTQTPDGRRVLIGWMQNWGTVGIKNPSEPWFGQMTIPRELYIKNGRIYQRPIREIEDLRTDKVEYKNLTLKDTVVLDGIKGRRADIELTIRPEDGVDLFQKFSLRFAQDDENYTALNFRPYESTLELDRTHSGSRIAVIHKSETKVNFKNELKLRLILDRFSAEVFINDGEKAMTVTMYTNESADGISFVADGLINADITKYSLI